MNKLPSKKKLLLLGSDDFHLPHVQKISRLSDYEVDCTFSISEMKSMGKKRESLASLVETIEQYIEADFSNIGGVVAYWDFPATLLQGFLCDRFNFHGPSLKAVLKCEHKFWSRIEQKKVVPEALPDFILFDPYNDPLDKLKQIELPYWIKPVKACSSQLAYKVESRSQEQEIVDKIAEKICSVSSPIGYFLEKVDRPAEVPSDSGHFCIVEHCLHGDLSTLEGYCRKGEVYTHALIDSKKDKFQKSFQSYQLPSRLPKKIENRMSQIAHKIMNQIGYNNSTFNIEFFYDKENEKVTVLEINPRISQSHTLPIEWVKGFSNQKLAMDIAMDRDLDIKNKTGSREFAGKFFLRHYHDAVVEAFPTEQEFKKILGSDRLSKIKIPLRKGLKLSELDEQDSYSFGLGDVFLSASSSEKLNDKFSIIEDKLNFKLKEI